MLVSIFNTVVFSVFVMVVQPCSSQNSTKPNCKNQQYLYNSRVSSDVHSLFVFEILGKLFWSLAELPQLCLEVFHGIRLIPLTECKMLQILHRQPNHHIQRQLHQCHTEIHHNFMSKRSTAMHDFDSFYQMHRL